MGPRKLASAIAFGVVGPESWRARYRVAVRRWLANKLAVHAEEDGNSVISVWRGVVQGSIPDTLLETNVDPETEKPGSTFICKKRLLQEQKTNHFRSLR